MPPPAPQVLLTSPADIYDLLGTEGVQLRLDDHNLATGQTITLSADAAVGATTLAVQELWYPLLKGSVLEFDGGGMPEVVEATLSAAAGAGATSLSVNAIPTAMLATAAARDSGVNTALAARLVKGTCYGTSQVVLYCGGRYDESQLALSYSVNMWATAIGARWVCERRNQSAPKGIQRMCDDAFDQLKQVRLSMLNIDNAGTRTSGFPFISNATVDIGYTTNKIRIEPNLSEGTPTQYGQYIDWSSALLLEW